jgi:hypothetical protein
MAEELNLHEFVKLIPRPVSAAGFGAGEVKPADHRAVVEEHIEHGGASTGPRTAEGVERCRRARWKHGERSAAAVAERKHRAEKARQAWEELRHLEMLLRLHRRPPAGGS